ncbi:MAG: hypothetical protein R2752_01825 [Vicinamibacterales bacterium]
MACLLAVLLLPRVARAQSPPAGGWFVQAGAIADVDHSFFRSVPGDPPEPPSARTQPGLRLAGGRWLSRRSTARIGVDVPRAQHWRDFLARYTHRSSMMWGELGFHPVFPRAARLGFLVGAGYSRGITVVRRDPTSRDPAPRPERRVDGRSMFMLGAESRWPVSARLDVVADIRMHLLLGPGAPSHVIARPGVSGRWRF